MINKFNILISSFVITLTLATSQLTYGSEVPQVEDIGTDNISRILPPELWEPIVIEAAIEQTLSDMPLDNLACVNQETHQIIEHAKQVKQPLWKVLQGITSVEDEETYQTFLNGKLVYRPTPGSDEGKIELKISDFLNPFKGTFNLSSCDYTSQYLTITTDPSVFFKRDTDKLNMLIAPHFLIHKYISTTTKPFENIMAKWKKDTAPVAIFWRCGSDDDLTWFDYLVSSSSSIMSSRNLYENWLSSVACAGSERAASGPRAWQNDLSDNVHVRVPGIAFMFIFEPK